MKFERVVDCFEQIEQVSGRLEITRLLADLLEEATPEEAAIIGNFSLGQLHPPYKGTQFNVAIKNIIKVVALVQERSEQEIAQEVKTVGDIGAVIAFSLATHESFLSNTISVEEVYHALCVLEQVSGSGSQEEKINQLVHLVKKVGNRSAKYVLRIILGTLRLGFSDMTLMDAFSLMIAGDKSLRLTIENAYNLCADIGFIVFLLKKEGIDALRSMKIYTGIPIRPASAERLPTANAIIEKIGPAVAQPKLDGFRIQIHIDNTGTAPRVNFFSRNLQDMSSMFPDLIPALLLLPVKNFIGEGEAICFDQNTGTFLPFQETVKRKRKHGIEQAVVDFPLKLFMFDLLYLDGKSLLPNSHTERRKELLNLFKSVHSDAIQVISEYAVHTGKELEDYFFATVALGLEGIVVKRPDAHYQPGKRNFNWIKLKRQEEGHLEDTIDCVILGYYAGSGKRAQFGIGAFLVGVFNLERDMFETVAKIGTGLKDAEWRALKTACDERMAKEKPHNIVCDKNMAPDVWVYPEVVCMVRADEITLSPIHTAGKDAQHLGYALRFPRIMGYRPDKGAQEATTVDEIKRLYEDQFLKKV